MTDGYGHPSYVTMYVVHNIELWTTRSHMNQVIDVDDRVRCADFMLYAGDFIVVYVDVDSVHTI